MAYDADLTEPAAAPEADGVTYTENPLAPGLRFFTCQPYRTTLSSAACAKRFERAQTAYGEALWEFANCRACSTGAAHAGRGVVYFGRWYDTSLCARCGAGGRRIIAKRLCVSCYNRAREMKIGRNGRGNKPVELLQNPPRMVELLVEINGEARRICDRNSSGTTETMIQFLRANTGRASFAFAGAGVQPRDAAAANAPMAAADLEPAGEVQLDAADPAEAEPSEELAGSDEPCNVPADVQGEGYRFRAALFVSTVLSPVKKTPAAGEETCDGLSAFNTECMTSRQFKS